MNPVRSSRSSRSAPLARFSAPALVLLLLLALALPPAVTGCGGGEPTAAGDVTFTYWSIFPVGDPAESVHNTMMRTFEDQNPGVTVEHVGTSFWDYWTKLQTAQAGNQGPDLFIQDICNVKGRAKDGVSANLEAYLKADKIRKDDYLASDIESCTWNDELYAMPFSTDARYLFWNKAHFEAAGLDPETPPKTLAELESFADQLTKYSEDGKTLEQVGFHPRLGNNIFVQMVWSQGGEFFDQDMNPTINTDKNIEVIEWWVRMVNKYPVRAFNAFSTQASAAAVSPFIQGKVSLLIDNNELAWKIKDLAPDLRFGVTAVPYDGEENRTAWSGGFTLEISAAADKAKQDAAWKFIRYMTGPEVQSNLTETLRWLPCLVDSLDALKEGADANELAIIEESKYRRHFDYVEASPQWWGYVDPQISKLEQGELTSARKAMDLAQAELLRQIENYRKTSGQE